MYEIDTRSGAEELDNFVASVSDLRSRAENQLSTAFAKMVVVFGRDDTADDQHNMLASLFNKRLLQLRNERVVSSCQAARTNNVNVVVDGLTGDFSRCLEETTDVDVEAQVGKAGGDDLCSAIVTVLSHLGDENAGVTAFVLGEGLEDLERCFIFFAALVSGLLLSFVSVSASDDRIFSNISAEFCFHGVGNLSNSRSQFDGLNCKSKQITLT